MAFVAGQYLVALGIVAVAVLITLTAPSIMGRISTRSTPVDVDPVQVKGYRQEHPGATIIDAVEATKRL